MITSTVIASWAAWAYFFIRASETPLGSCRGIVYVRTREEVASGRPVFADMKSCGFFTLMITVSLLVPYEINKGLVKFIKKRISLGVHSKSDKEY